MTAGKAWLGADNDVIAARETGKEAG